jgi:hypothetical protein
MNNARTPSLVLAAAPGKGIHVPDSFYDSDGTFFNILKNPPTLRNAGWNLRTHETPKLRDGEFWEVRNGNRKIERLYSDGSLVVTGSIDQDFLGWRQHPTPVYLHSLGVIEFVYEFTELYRTVLLALRENRITMNACRFKVGLRDLEIIPETLKLRPYQVHTWGFAGSPGETFELHKDFMKEVQLEISDQIYDPRQVGYKLALVIFLQFGVPSNAVPYTSIDETGNKVIDIEAIKRLG